LDTTTLSERFRLFAERECRGSSPLYGHLAANIANDTTILQLAAQSSVGQPVPNLLLGAVHYLLLRGIEHPLAEYYPSIENDSREPSTAFHNFKEFCIQYENELIQIIKSKLVQTNEVRRCTYLYPSFCYIHQLTGKPLALIEIGTSAGLQLLWDKYSYSYNTNGKYGDVNSVLEITAEIRGDKFPFLFEQSPPVTSRIGLDLHVNNVNDPEDYLWLKALIWPEHKERISHFNKAAMCVQKERLELIEGDGVSLLPHIASNIAGDSTICVFHTHVANQLPYESKNMLEEHIRALGQERDVFHLYNNMWDVDLHLDYYMGGKEYKNTVAKTDGHGRWFQWML
jgi:hypothetical protein